MYESAMASSGAAAPAAPSGNVQLDTAAIQNWAEFKRCYDDGGHMFYVAHADKCERFYNGDQWEDHIRKAIEAEGRPVLTINLSKRTINNILGHYDSQRADIVFKPRRGTAEEQAHAMTLTFDQILEQNGYQYVEREMFQSGIISDRGYLDVRLNFDRNVMGDVEITTVDSRDVVLDPEAKKYDPRTWSQVTVIRWLSLNQIEAHWGKEAADRVQSMVDTGEYYGSESVRFANPVIKSYGQISHDEEHKRIRAVRVIDRQHRRLDMVREFVDLVTGDTSPVPDNWDEARVQAVCARYQLATRKRMQERIRWTVSVDMIGLHDTWSPYDEFTIVPYFPYFTTGRPTGVMRDLISPQEQLNKTESQELHIVNTTANSGWVIEAGSLVNMTDEEIQKRGAETGLVLVYGRNRSKPEKIQPNSVPTGLERLSQKASIYLSDIHGVTALMGLEPKSEVSGVALDRAQASSLTGLQPIFSTLQYTRHILARVVLGCVQRFYTEARLLRVTDWRNPDEPQLDFEINTDVLNNITLGKYEITVGTAPSRDTQDEVQFAEALQLREAEIPIPGYHVVLASRLRGKRQIAEEVKKIEGFAEPTPEEVEAAQVQQELLLRHMTAEINKLESQALQYEAFAQKAMAEAQAALAAEDRAAFEAQTERAARFTQLQQDLAKKAADLINKVELAMIHTRAKSELTRYTTMMKSFDNRMKELTSVKVAEKRASSARSASKRPAKSRS